MTAPKLSTVATRLVQTYGNTAHNVVNAYRAGGERMGQLLEQRYTRALLATGDKLSPEVRENALVTQKIISAYYVKGIELASQGAGALIDNVIKYTGMGLEQVAANTEKFEGKAGASTLHALARAAVPAAAAVSDFAAKLEEKSAALAALAGGAKAPHATAFKKARARRL